MEMEISEEKYIKVIDALLGDPDLMMAVNQSESFEAGYLLVAKKNPDLSLDEFTKAMDLLKQIVSAKMKETEVQ